MCRKSFTIMLLFSAFVLADSWSSNRKGIKNYDQKNFADALENFQKAQSDDINPVVSLNTASSLYKIGDYSRAKQELARALMNPLKIEDSTLLSKLYYNMGNCYFRQDSLPQAIQFYEKSLQYDPNDIEAKYNLELARALLKQNMQPQCQQNQKNEQKQQEQQSQQTQNQQQEQPKQQEQQSEDEQQEQQEQQQRAREGEMTKEEAEQLMDAMECGDREQVKQNIDDKKQTGRYVNPRDW